MSAQYYYDNATTFTITVRLPFIGRSIQRLTTALVAVGGDLESIKTVAKDANILIREYCITANNPFHRDEIIKAVKTVPELFLMGFADNHPEDGDLEVLALSPVTQRL